jgi:hypothetical protein
MYMKYKCFWKHDMVSAGWEQWGDYTKWFSKCSRCNYKQSSFDLRKSRDNMGIGQAIVIIIGTLFVVSLWGAYVYFTS